MINPKIWDGERCKFGKVLEKFQNYRFLDIFWDILNKMKDNLGQECIKWVFCILDPTFPTFPSLKLGIPTQKFNF